MLRIVIDEPYVPVPAHRGRFWTTALKPLLPWLLRRKYGFTGAQLLNTERLGESLRAGHGIVLAPNHCRDEDPLVLGLLARELRAPCYIMSSWHVFKQNRLQTWLLPRLGAFSIYREGMDRGALNFAIESVASAERPLVIFPEGFIARTNDRLHPLLEGVSLIARSAAKKRAKLAPGGKIVVHPVALRYHFHGDIEAVAHEVLDEIEARLTWPPRRDAPLLARMARVGEALLTLKELQCLGHPQTGPLDVRLRALIDAVLSPLENEWCGARHDGSTNERVKRLRTAILPDLVKGDIDEAERARRWRHLADAYLAMQLNHYPPGYLTDNRTPFRILETIERFEEDLTDRVRVHGPVSATITVGEAIEVGPAREGRGGADPLLAEIDRQLRMMLGITENFNGGPAAPAPADSAP